VLVLVLSQCNAQRASLPPDARSASAAVTAPTAPSAPPLASVSAQGGAAEPPATATAPKPLATPELVVPESQIYRVPDIHPGERRPLLIFLHGLGASGKTAFDVLHLAELGARERIFVLAPDGDVDHQKRRFWNAGPSCSNFDRAPVDDVARLTALIDQWRARPDVDPARVYLTGHSNGGFMTERLACSLGQRIAAAASLSGAAPASESECAPSAPLALLEVHGDADAIVHYAGGSVFDSPALAAHPAIEQGFRDWAKRFGCTGEPKSGPDLDLDSRLPGAETRVEQYPSCARGSVALWTVRGGSHYVGTGTQAFEAVWRFLSAHHR
jgi:polyhydroxybutyrate depolymerase